MRAAAYGDLLIRAGDHQVVLAGGMESMSNAPYLLTQARDGYASATAKLVDAHGPATASWDLQQPHMGESTREVVAESRLLARGPGRAGRCGATAGAWRRQDAGAFKPRRSSRSRCPAARATRSSTPTRARAATPRSRGWRSCGRRSSKDGTVTAGNAPGLNDGARGAGGGRRATGRKRGAEAAGADHRLRDRRRRAEGPVLAPVVRRARSCSEKTGMTVGRLRPDRGQRGVRASQALADGQELGWDWKRVNVQRRRGRARAPDRRLGRARAGHAAPRARGRGGGSGLAAHLLGRSAVATRMAIAVARAVERVQMPQRRASSAAARWATASPRCRREGGIDVTAASTSTPARSRNGRPPTIRGSLDRLVKKGKLSEADRDAGARRASAARRSRATSPARPRGRGASPRTSRSRRTSSGRSTRRCRRRRSSPPTPRSISITQLAAATKRARPRDRHALHEPGAGHAAGRGDPRPRDQRRDVRRGRGAGRASWARRRSRSTTIPGFVSNRILMPMINEAVYCLMEGVATARPSTRS